MFVVLYVFTTRQWNKAMLSCGV